MFFSTSFLVLAGSLFAQTQALGINCRGSGACPLASFLNDNNESVMEVMRHVVLASTKDNSTTYNSGDHISCVASGMKVDLGAGIGVGAGPADGSVEFSTGGTAHPGGICLFPENLKAPLKLGDAKELVDALIKHSCSACGSVPVDFITKGSNDPGNGILTFNFVAHPDCVGSCIDPEDPAPQASAAGAPQTSATVAEASDTASTSGASASKTDGGAATTASGSAAAATADSAAPTASDDGATATDASTADPTDAEPSATDASAPSHSVPTPASFSKPGKGRRGHIGRKRGPMRRTPFKY